MNKYLILAPKLARFTTRFTLFTGALSLAFTVTCDIVLGTAPTDAVCQQRLDGTDAVAEVVADPNASPPVVGVAAASAIPADLELTGKAGRRRRSIIRRGAASEYQESTG